MSVLSCQSPRNQRGAAECQSIICGRDQHQHRASRVTTAALVSTAMKRKNERKITSGDILRISHWRRIKKNNTEEVCGRRKKKKQVDIRDYHPETAVCVSWCPINLLSIFTGRKEWVQRTPTHPTLLHLIHMSICPLSMPLSKDYRCPCLLYMTHHVPQHFI